jgi:quercetin dioxygenase-like cupin family protein
MIVINPDQQAGPTGKQGAQFTGPAFPYLTMPSTDGVAINTVDFAPGARTFWHSHENGQILQVLAGRGLVGAQDGPVHMIRTGDTVWSPPGESHWHGAAPDSYLVHTAISLGVTTWADAVTDVEYVDPDQEGGR